MATHKLVAKDLMTKKVVCAYPETPIKQVIKILVDYDIDGVPVIDKREKLIGVVSKTDILEYNEKEPGKRIPKGGKSFYHDTNGRSKKDFEKISKEKDFGKAVVKDIMTSHVVTADADETIDRLAKKMYQEKIHRIIIQEDRKVIGVVSTLDILHVISTIGYGSAVFTTEKTIQNLRKRLEAAEKAIQSLRNTFDKMYRQ